MLLTKELTPEILVKHHRFFYNQPYNKFDTVIKQLQPEISPENIIEYLCSQNILVYYDSLQFELNSNYPLPKDAPNTHKKTTDALPAVLTDTVPDTHIISFFEHNIKKKNAKPTKNLPFAKIIELVKSDKYKAIIEKLNTFKYATNEYNEYKQSYLFHFIPTGIFSKNGNDFLIETSNIICLDIDFKDNPNLDLTTIKEKLHKEKCLLGYFVSPSQIGLKVFIKALYTKDNHKETAGAITDFFEQEYSLKLDYSAKTLSQSCFVSYDKAAYYNEFASFFNGFIAPKEIVKQSDAQPKPTGKIAPHSTVFEFIRNTLEKQNRFFCDGQKHSYLVHFACFANRYGCDYDSILSYVDSNFIAKESIKSNCLTYPCKTYTKDFGTKTYKKSVKNLNGYSNILDCFGTDKVGKRLKTEIKTSGAPEEWLNQNTGEIKELPDFEQTTKYNYSLKGCFYESKDVAKIMNKSNSLLTIKIVLYIKENLVFNKPEICLKWCEIEKYHGASLRQNDFNKSILFLIEHNLIAKKAQKDEYFVNFNLMFFGNFNQWCTKVFKKK